MVPYTWCVIGGIMILLVGTSLGSTFATSDVDCKIVVETGSAT